ncbi:MAG: Succinate semialdehyde dehydrogenase [NAD(P)+] Sad [Gammaproteobacteria bacterium]|nr:Succinate semialdehyde dehydrogenase [NAD(P)+] Sad [Gammaproteobacteria bacterium]
MKFETVNPATGEHLQSYPFLDEGELQDALAAVGAAAADWRATPIAERAAPMRRAGEVLRARRDEFAAIICTEMGKLIREARAEVEKCAWVCEYYAEEAARMLADEPVVTDAGHSYVAYQPLGVVLAVMPWNFPFWQAFRFAAPGVMAGNCGILKHAPNVPRCALAIEEVFTQAGFPRGVFRTLFIDTDQAARVIDDPRVHAVTLTGSEAAGRKVAQRAGAALKKAVLELGGSDPFIVLEDADLDLAASTAVAARYMNAGQSCIAAKRFILTRGIADEFLVRFKAGVENLRPGDPMQESTTLAPMARADLRDGLHAQVRDSLAKGALAVTGCEPIAGPGWYYAPSILDRVTPGVRAYEEELFGPVAIVIRVGDESEAVRVANGSRYGLGASVWTRDAARGERVARLLESGMAFVNGLVKSDPRLPFGGVKASGFGRECSHHGIREFTNVKTVWVR